MCHDAEWGICTRVGVEDGAGDGAEDGGRVTLLDWWLDWWTGLAECELWRGAAELGGSRHKGREDQIGSVYWCLYVITN